MTPKPSAARPAASPRACHALALLVLAALPAGAAFAQATATDPADADAGSSYALRHSTLWFDRYTNGQFTHGVALADFNKDGRIDALLASGTGQDVRTPVRILIQQPNGSFVDETATRLTNAQPGIIHARKALVGDYNHDGWPDVFVVGHGYDQPPFPGEYPQLFLSNGNGTLRYDNQLEAHVGFLHAAASGDIDNNGSVDILVVKQGAPYVLINDGQGHFTKDDTRLPAELQWKNHYTGELFDLDEDGTLDVVLGGHEFEGAESVVYWGNRTGRFDATRKFVAPIVASQGIIMDFAAADIDGDGLRDLVLDRTGHSPFYSGRGFQVLRQTAPRAFADETGARITMDTTQGWMDFVRLQDADGDGDADLFIDDKHASLSGQYLWKNNGQGVFATAGGTIVPAPVLRVRDASIVEGAPGASPVLAFVVESSQPIIAPVSFDLGTSGGTARAGTDYVELVQPDATLTAGQSQLVVNVTVTGDAEVEPGETVTLNLLDPVGATVSDAQGLGRIQDDDLPTLTIADASVAEGANGRTTLRFDVLLSHAVSAPVQFDVATVAGSATAGVDYVALAQPARRIDAGRTRQVVEVQVLGDVAVESDEGFTVTLSNLAGALAGDVTATGTILNDDAAAAAPARSPATGAVTLAPRACSVLAREIATLEDAVAAGRLAERKGVTRILAAEARLRALRCP